MRIKKSDLSYIIIYTFICLFLGAALGLLTNCDGNIQTMMSYISIATIIELCFYVGISSAVEGSLLNFANLFILILWLFNFGQVFLVGLNIIQNLTIYLNYFSVAQNYEAFKYINFAFAAISIGMLCAQSINKSDIEAKRICKTDYNYLRGMQKKAIFLIAVTFPVKVVIDIPTLLIGLTQGFGAANVWQNSIPDVIVTYGTISIIGIGLWIVSLREEERKQKIVFISFILYIVVMMMGGKRSENVAYICILFLLFAKSRNMKLNLKKIVVYVVFAYLLLTILSTIVYARQYVSERNIRTLSETFWQCLTTKNMFISACRDYGTTGYTAECVITYWLPNYSPSHGMSYIGGLASIFPNIGDIFGKINRSTGFAFLLQQNHALDPRYINIGGSMIGELFFNFGIWGGICGSYVVGTIIGTVSRKVTSYLGHEIDFKVVYYVALMSALTYWVRDYFGGISREIVWSFAVCWIISKMKIKSPNLQTGGKI